ncbi:MAG TPA: hypothetical protein VNM91_08665, partial [Dehalococcoidia bacterium]|nr:hypothetical protein [Dehalococcoidia bacterium]
MRQVFLFVLRDRSHDVDQHDLAALLVDSGALPVVAGKRPEHGAQLGAADGECGELCVDRDFGASEEGAPRTLVERRERRAVADEQVRPDAAWATPAPSSPATPAPPTPRRRRSP